MRAGADWAAWLPGICQVGRLVRRPGGPPRQILKLVKRLSLLTCEGQGMDEGERMERHTTSQRGGEGRREWNEGGAHVSLAKEGGLYLDPV